MSNEQSTHDDQQPSGEGGNDQTSMLRDLAQQGRRAFKLIRDKRVPTLHKLIPVGALVYLVSPIDLISELLGPVGVVDDLVIMLLALRLFNRLAGEHVAQLEAEDGADSIPADYRVHEDGA